MRFICANTHSKVNICVKDMICMCLMLLLMFCKGSAVNLPRYYSENTLFVDEKKTVNISCLSSLQLNYGSAITWFKITLKNGEPPQLIISCLESTVENKFECDTVRGSSRLKIYDVQSQDSGVYFCTLLYRSILTIADGNNLIVRNSLMFPVPVHLLTPAHDNVSVQLACLVQKAFHTIYMRWNISGAYYMGRMSSTNEPDGTWTFLNYISLPVDSWNQSDVACEVWIGSSFVSLTWKRSQKVLPFPSSAKCPQMCSFCVRFVLVVCILLALVICVHLSSAYI